jgi:bifunctional non-homologous end joining protein LigD
MPCFVIQRHFKKKTKHFDLMLEYSGRLKTWSFSNPLKRSKLETQKLKPLPDHRLKYLKYEGEISNGRGRVKIWDKGFYRGVIMNKNFSVLQMQGKKIKGLIIILSLPHRSHPLLIPLIRFQ